MILIRNIERADAAMVQKICAEDLGYPCDRALVEEKIVRLDGRREAVFVAEVDGTVAGFIHVETYDTLYFETMANILGLAVSAQFRRAGIGSRLIAAAESWAAQHNIRLVRVNSGGTRTGAHSFYRACGYNSEKDQRRFLKRLPGATNA